MTIFPVLLCVLSAVITQSTNSTESTQCHNSFLHTTFINICSKNQFELDSVCHVYFPFNGTDSSYLAYLSGVTSYGSVRMYPWIVNVDSTNSFTFSSVICTFSQKVTTVGRFLVGIREILSGDCKDIIYPVVVGYKCPHSGSPNDLPQIRDVCRSYGLDCSDLVVLPRRHPAYCVTQRPSNNTGSTADCTRQRYKCC